MDLISDVIPCMHHDPHHYGAVEGVLLRVLQNQLLQDECD
jgi:hypothetical protein